jgi:tetratricopeptide (TPR) repeat protein
MGRTMITDGTTRRAGLPHAVFLQRVTDEPAGSPQVQLGQGAFLALRFVDLLAPDREPPTPDVFRYQWAATERYCAELAGEGTEASHLSGIVRATGDAHRSGDVRLLAPALLAYGLYLEQECHFEEAEDALHTLIDVGGTWLATTDIISAWMRLGRVLRLQADFDRADAAYAQAGTIAAHEGACEMVVSSRIGQCNVTYFRGNLAEAEHGWRAVLADATALGFRRGMAEAEHGLGNALERRGQPADGATHLWRAYELYEDRMLQLRTLKDLGSVLLRLGDVEAAEHALAEVVRRDNPGENLSNALIDLMHCASTRYDRVGFERWRERCLEHIGDAAPNLRTDFALKAGIGYARFGNYRRAGATLHEALEIASAHGLHEFVFRIERTIAGLNDCGAPEPVESAAVEPPHRSESLRELSASLAALGG